MKTYKELTAKETEKMSNALTACAEFKSEKLSEKQFLQRVKGYTFATVGDLHDNAKAAIISHFDTIEADRAKEVIMPSKKDNKELSKSVDTVYRGLNGCIKKYKQTMNSVNGEELKTAVEKHINDSSLKEDQAAAKITYLKDDKNSFIDLRPFWFAFPVLELTPSKKEDDDGIRQYHYTCKDYDYNHANNSDYFLSIVDAFLFSDLDTHKEAKINDIDTQLTAARLKYNVLIASKKASTLKAFKAEQTAGKDEQPKIALLKSIDDIIEKLGEKDLQDEIKRAKIKVAKLRAEFAFLED